MIEQIWLANARVSEWARDRTEVWMSRETLTMLQGTASMRYPDGRDFPLALSLNVTLFGLPIKLDDRMPHGQISFETRDVINVLPEVAK